MARAQAKGKLRVILRSTGTNRRWNVIRSSDNSTPRVSLGGSECTSRIRPCIPYRGGSQSPRLHASGREPAALTDARKLCCSSADGNPRHAASVPGPMKAL